MSATPSLEIAAVRRAAGMPRECLTLRLGDEAYGIDIHCVQEIRGYEPLTRVAGAPAGVRGVLHLRGTIVPVVDLRDRLGLEARFDAATVTVILDLGGGTVGAVVDAVSDVVTFHDDQLRPAPAFNGSARGTHLSAVARHESGGREQLLPLLDIEALMAETGIGRARLAA